MWLLQLTDGERTLLRENSGCFKCRQFFQNHVTLSCPNSFPDVNRYTTLIAADMEAACTKKCPKPVAAVIEDEPVPKRIRSEDTVAEPIVVELPSAALGDSSDSGDGYIALFSVPHFFWSCLLDGPNDSLSSVDALIDHCGSHLVLIESTLVEKLGLRPCMLPTPFDVSVAVSPHNHKSLSLSQYVQLSCQLLDSQFCSRPFRAIMAPQLCMPLLLGGPFLYSNRIVIDHELQTCISKDTGYDLFNSPVGVGERQRGGRWRVWKVKAWFERANRQARVQPTQAAFRVFYIYKFVLSNLEAGIAYTSLVFSCARSLIPANILRRFESCTLH